MKVQAALIGFGVIGSGVVKLLQEHRGLLKKRGGVEIAVTRVIDLDITADRGVDLEGVRLSTDYTDAINDDEIDIVIELIGGTTVAKTIVEAALKKGKHVVTANKALLFKYAKELFALAREKRRELRYEASVAGGIPIIKIILESLSGDKIDTIYGIVNGTTNFILTKMIEERWSFKDALLKAQELGFAEADPTLDVNGGDAANKLGILATIAFNSFPDNERIYVEGIDAIDSKDVRYANDLGYVVKLLAVAKHEGKGVTLRVCPTLIPEKSIMANVSNEFNAVMLNSAYLGESIYIGKGAGSFPTASAVVSDVHDIAKDIADKAAFNENRYSAFNQFETLSVDEVVSRFYVRLSVVEKVGTLATVTKLLGDNNISIASIIQQGEAKPGASVPVVLLTYQAKEKDMRAAISAIDASGLTEAKTVVMHVEDLKR